MGKELEQIFLQSRHTNGQQICERWSVSLIIREMQTKTTLSYYHTPVMKVIDKNNKIYLCEEIETFVHSCLEC